MTIWYMRFARWIPKATNTHSQYVIRTAFPQQQWLHERPSVLYAHCVSSLAAVLFVVCLIARPSHAAFPTSIALFV